MKIDLSKESDMKKTVIITSVLFGVLAGVLIPLDYHIKEMPASEVLQAVCILSVPLSILGAVCVTCCFMYKIIKL